MGIINVTRVWEHSNMHSHAKTHVPMFECTFQLWEQYIMFPKWEHAFPCGDKDANMGNYTPNAFPIAT